MGTGNKMPPCTKSSLPALFSNQPPHIWTAVRSENVYQGAFSIVEILKVFMMFTSHLLFTGNLAKTWFPNFPPKKSPNAQESFSGF